MVLKDYYSNPYDLVLPGFEVRSIAVLVTGGFGKFGIGARYISKIIVASHSSINWPWRLRRSCFR